METYIVAAAAILLASLVWNVSGRNGSSRSTCWANLPLVCFIVSLAGGTLSGLLWQPHLAAHGSSRPRHLNTLPSSAEAKHGKPTRQLVLQEPPREASPSPSRSLEETRPTEEPEHHTSSTTKDFRPVIYRGPTTKNQIAFVFDDGPHPTRTPRLLDMLREHDARASFAVLATKVKQYPELAKRIVTESHTLVLHGETHRSFVELDGLGELEGEIDRSLDVIREVTGVTPTYVRPPYGDVTSSLANKLYDRWGLKTLMWNVDPEDYRLNDSEQIFVHLSQNTTPGSINVLHDHVSASLEATRMFIDTHPALKLVTVDELLSTRQKPGDKRPTAKKQRKLSFQVVPMEPSETFPAGHKGSPRPSPPHIDISTGEAATDPISP